MSIFETMKKALEKALAEDKFIGNYDYENDNITSYNLVDAVREAEEADDDFDWSDCFTDALDEVVKENGLKLFSNNDSIPLFYCKPENKQAVVDFLLDEVNINLHIYIEDGIYTDYLENGDYSGEQPKSFDEFFKEWVEEISLI